MDGCKTAMPLAVIGAIVGEFVGSERGLGYLILEATAQARTDLLFAALVAVSILAGLLYWVVELLANRVWWRALVTIAIRPRVHERTYHGKTPTRRNVRA